ncbi:MAG: transketolase family protein [Rickettsiales bacterium]|jgi:transketolase|nr:transketolase family protein [Rickettsiales bacterium]
MKFTNTQLIKMSGVARAGALRAIRAAGGGHLGIVMGAADILTALYASHLNLPDDRFVLSAGHGSALLYSVLKLRGYDLPPLESFRKTGGLPGHPELSVNGVSAATGPLGQGVGMSVGMAFAEKIKNTDSRIYCLASDGDLSEGVAGEAIAVAGRYKLNNLILLWDDNGITIDGAALTDLDLPMRFRAAGWNVLKCNGNKFSEINAALTAAKKSRRPVFIQCKTILGFGTRVAGTPLAHGMALSTNELDTLIQKYDDKIGENLWSQMGKISTKNLLINNIKGGELVIDNSENSTRELSGKYLEKLLKLNPKNMIGLSADLSKNTNVFTDASVRISGDNFNGNFLDVGVREHAMAAIMNGLCLGGFYAYGGAFLVFSDYMRGAMRLSALMGLPVIYVLTHDSILVGEDGPTHQPIEQIAGLRLMPNMNVFRPSNAAEIKASWDMALNEKSRPSCIILSRQKFLQIAGDGKDLEFGTEIITERADAKITLIATGSEVPLAIQVAEKIKARVVSMFSVEKFRASPDEHKSKILRGRVIAIEAGASAAWYEFADAVVGIDRFGVSGDGAQIYREFGFDSDIIADEISKNFQ